MPRDTIDADSILDVRPRWGSIQGRGGEGARHLFQGIVIKRFDRAAFVSQYRHADEIASLALRYNALVAAEEFQLWKLTVREDRTATLAWDDGNGNLGRELING